MKLATEEQGATYLGIARSWLEATTQWSSSKSAALSAVAEYVANHNGHTLYESRAIDEQEL